jgi:cellulose synthase/poly-beta-1,6-N-acetylglucosamine synthase-like glycosyltransferase
MVFPILTAIFLLFYGLLIEFYRREWKKLRDFEAAGASPGVFVSVVIAARDEENTIGAILADLQRQDYPADRFEVIVVDDFSTDRTADLVREQFPAVRLLVPPCSPAASSKKIAIHTGVTAANGPLILVTDADCRVKPGWISSVAAFNKMHDAAFIAAPVQYTYDRSLLQRFQALDFLILQGITAASVSSGFHNMCNGANLAYTKAAFLRVNGFEGIDQVATGDDMLLIHKIWKQDPGKVFYLKSKDAIVETAPMIGWRDFLMQRRRWASKTLVYEDKKIIGVLGFVFLFNLFFFVLVAAALFDSKYWMLPLIYLVAKPVIEFPFVASIARFFRVRGLLKDLFLLQPIHLAYTVFVGLISQFGKYEWKGRRTR